MPNLVPIGHEICLMGRIARIGVKNYTVGLSFIFGTQMKIFLIQSESWITPP